jgi:hypothetical protein
MVFLDRVFGWRPQALETPTLPASEGAGRDRFALPRTPAVEHAFRSIARNPSRYATLLCRVQAAPSQARGEIAVAWMREHFPAAWPEVRETYAGLRHTHALPHRLRNEEAMLALVADQWGASLSAWADHLARTSPAFRAAVEQPADRSEPAPIYIG